MTLFLHGYATCLNIASNIQELRHEISVWQRAAASLSSYSKDEDLVRETLQKKVNRLKGQLKKRIASGSVPADNYKATLGELQAKVGRYVHHSNKNSS